MHGFVGLAAIGVVIALDNVRVALPLGAAVRRDRDRIRLAVLFGLFESAMPLVGALAGASLVEAPGGLAELVGPAALGACGVAMIHEAGRDRDPDLLGLPLAQVLLPLSLSFDNLFAGVGLGALGYPPVVSAVAIGTVSGGLSLVALKLGSVARRAAGARARLVPGAALLVAAAVAIAWP